MNSENFDDGITQVAPKGDFKAIKRQGLIVTLGELYRLIEDLEEQFEWKKGIKFMDEERKFQINIINKTPKCSDTWEIDK